MLLSDRHFVPHQELKCLHCLSVNVSSFRARQRKREDYLERLEKPGKGAAAPHWGSYRISTRQNSPQPISSLDEAGRGTHDRSRSPVSISSSTQRDLEVELALRDSPSREGEPPVSLSQTSPSLVSVLVAQLGHKSCIKKYLLSIYTYTSN